MAQAKGSRITGDQRAALASQYAQRYAAGESIRAIAADGGRSFGFVHGVLKESGVELRGRGGATRGGSPADSAASSTKAAAKKTATTKTASKAPTTKTAKASTTKTAKAPTTKTAKAPSGKKASTTKTAG